MFEELKSSEKRGEKNRNNKNEKWCEKYEEFSETTVKSAFFFPLPAHSK